MENEELDELERDLLDCLVHYRILSDKFKLLLKKIEGKELPKDYLIRLTKLLERTGIVSNLQSTFMLSDLGEEVINKN